MHNKNNEIIKIWEGKRGKIITEKELLKLIYSGVVAKNVATCKKQINRFIKKIKDEKKYKVSRQKINKAYTYTICQADEKDLKKFDVDINMMEVESYLEKTNKSDMVFSIVDYIGKNQRMKNYDLVYPLEICRNHKNKKLSFFWAIISDPQEFKIETVNATKILADPEIKRFYFTRIKKISEVVKSGKTVKNEPTIKTFIIDIEKKFPKILLFNNSSNVDDFGYLKQNNIELYDMKTFSFQSDSYFKSILETQHEDLYDAIKSKKEAFKKISKNNGGEWKMTIRYVDIQRIVNLIFPYLSHIKVDPNDKEKIIKHIEDKLKHITINDIK